MIILSAAALSFALVSAAWAVPTAPKADLPALNQSDIIQVGHGHGGKGKGKHYGGHKQYNKQYNRHTSTTTISTAVRSTTDATIMVAAIGDAATTTVPTTGRLSAASSSVFPGSTRDRRGRAVPGAIAKLAGHVVAPALHRAVLQRGARVIAVGRRYRDGGADPHHRDRHR